MPFFLSLVPLPVLRGVFFPHFRVFVVGRQSVYVHTADWSGAMCGLLAPLIRLPAALLLFSSTTTSFRPSLTGPLSVRIFGPDILQRLVLSTYPLTTLGAKGGYVKRSALCILISRHCFFPLLLPYFFLIRELQKEY